jgi:hypothetical protein
MSVCLRGNKKKFDKLEKMAVEETKKDYLPKFWSFLFKNWKFYSNYFIICWSFANGMKGDFVSEIMLQLPKNPMLVILVICLPVVNLVIVKL